MEKNHSAKTRTNNNSKISPNFLVWKFCGKAQFPQCDFPQNYHTRKFGEIPVY